MLSNATPVTNPQIMAACRLRHHPASDVASICGVGYRGALEVWAEKKGLIQPKGDSPILQRGRWFEPAIWTAIGEKTDWQLRAAKVYLRAPGLRFGATPDALALDPARKGLVLIQGKVVAKPVFIADWLGGDREGTEPSVPLGYQLQTLSRRPCWPKRPSPKRNHPSGARGAGRRHVLPELHLIPVQRHARGRTRRSSPPCASSGPTSTPAYSRPLTTRRTTTRSLALSGR